MADDMANELGALRKVIAAHLQSDERYLDEMRHDLRALREDSTQMRLDFNMHVTKYDAEQDAWREKLLGADGRPLVGPSAPGSVEQNSSKLVYLVTGATLASSVIWEFLRHLAEALPKILPPSK